MKSLQTNLSVKEHKFFPRSSRKNHSFRPDKANPEAIEKKDKFIRIGGKQIY